MTTSPAPRPLDRERDHRLRTLFEDAPLGFAVVDRSGRILEANARFRELLVRTEAELEGLTFREITHPDDARLSSELFDQLLEGRLPGYTYEKRYLRPDGDTVHARTTVRRVTADRADEAGVFAMAVIEDITERKQAEREVAYLHRELQIREERYRTLVTNVPGAIYRREIAPPHRIRFVSDAVLDIVGVDAASLMDRRASFLDLVHPDDRDLVSELARGDISIGESYVLDYRVMTAGGEVRWVQDRGRAIAGRIGADAELFDGIVSDITQRKLAEQRLREHELRERTRQQEREHLDAIEGLTRASLAVNSPMRLAEMLDTIAETARQVIGARQAVIVTTPDGDAEAVVSESVDPETDEPGHVAVPAPRSRLHGELFDERRTVRRTGGDVVDDLQPVQGDVLLPPRGFLAAPLIARDGHPIGLLALSDKDRGPFRASDEALVSQLAQTAAVAIEKARLAELAAVREAARFRDELMAGMSHDMQTPLSAIVGTARMLREDPDAPTAERVVLYDVLTRQSARLHTLVQQFLDHARLEADRPLVVRPRRVDLHAALGYTQRLFQHQREVVVDVPDDAPAVEADPDRLQQVLGNLVSNAITFSTDAVQLTASWDDLDVHIEVVDHGIGMDADDLANLFGKFHRGSNAEGTHGTGLGLYVSRAVAEAMHGSLMAASTPGEGSRFRLTLPRAPS